MLPHGVTEILDRIEDLDLAKYIREGDTVVWGQACAEPPSLTEALLAQRGEIGRVRCVLAGQDRFVAINSALEVDLSGQVNAEVAGGSYVGAVGGAVDFLRGAARSRGGVPIVALPAERIVATLSGPVSTARSDAGVIVT